MGGKITRRVAALTLASWLYLGALPSLAQDSAVPISLQVELLARILWYDRGLQRSTDRGLRVLIVERARDAASARTAAQLAAQLSQVKLLGGKQVALQRTTYESVEQVERVAQQERAYLTWVTAPLGEVGGQLARALGEHGVLTITSHGADVAHGVVLGFELASGKPRVLLNLQQARAQRIDFNAQLLRVVKVLP